MKLSRRLICAAAAATLAPAWLPAYAQGVIKIG